MFIDQVEKFMFYIIHRWFLLFLYYVMTAPHNVREKTNEMKINKKNSIVTVNRVDRHNRRQLWFLLIIVYFFLLSSSLLLHKCNCCCIPTRYACHFSWKWKHFEWITYDVAVEICEWCRHATCHVLLNWRRQNWRQLWQLYTHRSLVTMVPLSIYRLKFTRRELLMFASTVPLRLGWCVCVCVMADGESLAFQMEALAV